MSAKGFIAVVQMFVLVQKNRSRTAILQQYLGRIIPGLGNNHGDRFRPQDLGLWDPFQMA